MDNKERVKILEKSFTIFEDILTRFMCEEEELFRINVAQELSKRLDSAENEDDVLAIQETKKKFDELSFDELCEIYDIVAEDDESEYSEEEREKQDIEIRASEILLEAINKIFIRDESLLRDRIRNYLNFEITENEEPLEYRALVRAGEIADSLTFSKLCAIHDISMDDEEEDEEEWEEPEIETPKVFAGDKLMRHRVLNAEYGDIIGFTSEKNHFYVFRLMMRLEFNGKYYCYMIQPSNVIDCSGGEGKFFEYVVGKTKIEDKLVLVEDEQLLVKLGKLL